MHLGVGYSLYTFDYAGSFTIINSDRKIFKKE